MRCAGTWISMQAGLTDSSQGRCKEDMTLMSVRQAALLACKSCGGHAVGINCRPRNGMVLMRVRPGGTQ